MSENLSNIIDIKHINLADKRFEISLSPTDITALANSIKNTGLIYLPLLRPVNNNSYIVISGFNRINALIKNNISRTMAVIVPEKTSDLDCFKKAIAAIAFKRPLTHAELIVCIKRLTPLCDLKKIEDMAPDVFNFQLNEKFIKDLCRIGNLPDPCLNLIHKEHLTIKSAGRLTDFNPQTTTAFLDLFSKIKASSSKQMEIITHMTEITARDGISIEKLYRDEQFQKILLNPDVPMGIKTNEIRQFLYQRRFPTIFNMRREVQNQINRLKLGSTMKFVPPENFEGRQYSLSFTAKNMEEFKAHLKKLNTINEDTVLEQIFKT